jgi:ribosomal-protein-serine acetyltransferase
MTSELTDGTICLRPPRRAEIDAALVAVRASIAELTTWTSWCHADYSYADVETFLRKVETERFEDRGYDFYICDRAETRVLGGCGLYHIDRATCGANLGYWVRSDATGRGIATAAGRLLARFGFHELGLARIEIIAAVKNTASQRVAEKIGAVREGLLRNRLRFHGRQIDAVGFSLIPADLGLAAPS